MTRALVNASLNWLKVFLVLGVKKIISPIALKFHAYIKFLDFAFFDFLDENALLPFLFLTSTTSLFSLSVIFLG